MMSLYKQVRVHVQGCGMSKRYDTGAVRIFMLEHTGEAISTIRVIRNCCQEKHERMNI